MMRSLYSGVSGLKNHQTRMDVIGNNIANVNTTGFKGGRVTFQDMLSQSLTGASGPQGNLGGTNPQQIGLGVGLGSIDTIFTDGSVQSTGNNTDLAISGNGFFIVSDGTKDYYTRNGAFPFDQQGNYVLPGSGMHVKGWLGDSTGKISTSGPVQNIVIPQGQTMSAKPTTSANAAGNLSADDPVRKTETKIGLTTQPGTAMPVVGTTTNGSGVITSVSNVQGPTAAQYTMTMTVPSYTSTFTPPGPPPGPPVVSVVRGTMPNMGDPIYNNAVPPVQMGTVTSVNAATGTFDMQTQTAIPLPITYPTDAFDANGVSYIATPANNFPPAVPPPNTTYGVVVPGVATQPTTAQTLNVYSYDARITTPGQRQTVSFSSFDALGVEHLVTGVLEKTAAVPGTSTTWTFIPSQSTDAQGNLLYVDRTTGALTTTPTANTDPAYRDNTGANISIAGGTPGSMTLTFDSKGNMDPIASNPAATITLTQPTLTPPVPNAGAQQSSFSLDFSALTGFGGKGTGTNLNIEQDGYTAGSLTSVSLDSSGTITGTFSNNQKKALAQVALATFNNPGGLEKEGSSLYSKSNNSGEVRIGTAGTGGAGKLTPAAVEMSNVNLSEQFSDMIITQRGFQSNSKIITVSDEMIETLVNLKR